MGADSDRPLIRALKRKEETVMLGKSLVLGVLALLLVGSHAHGSYCANGQPTQLKHMGGIYQTSEQVTGVTTVAYLWRMDADLIDYLRDNFAYKLSFEKKGSDGAVISNVTYLCDGARHFDSQEIDLEKNEMLVQALDCDRVQLNFKTDARGHVTRMKQEDAGEATVQIAVVRNTISGLVSFARVTRGYQLMIGGGGFELQSSESAQRGYGACNGK
jgi:hypothetical protein